MRADAHPCTPPVYQEPSQPRRQAFDYIAEEAKVCYGYYVQFIGKKEASMVVQQ